MWGKIIIYALCFATLISGCKEEKNKYAAEVIKINPYEAQEEINLSEIVDSVKYIKLQTDSNCVMGRITRFFIKEKYIYAVDVSQQIIFVFDKNGKYVSKLDKRGKGPDEYLHLGHAFIDDDEKFVEVENSRGKESRLLKYSNILFNLVDDKQTMPGVSSNSCRREGDIYYYATQQIENRFTDKPTNAGILVVKDGKIVKKLFDKNIVTGNSTFSYNIECFTKNDKNELFVSLMYDNTFYQLKNMNEYPILNIDFGKYSIDNSIGLKSTKEQLKYLQTINGLTLFPVLDINNSDIMVFTYNFKQNIKETILCHYIKLKNFNKIFHTKKIKNDITGFPEDVVFCTYNRIGCEVWYKDYLVEIVQPGYELDNKKGETKKIVNGLGLITSEDNPIIVLMKLKKGLK